MAVEIFNKRIRPDKALFREVNSGEVVVETVGYVSPRKLIQSYMDAGERLQAYRQQEYGIQPAIVRANDTELEARYQEAEEKMELDVTRNKGFTQVEADEQIRAIARNQKGKPENAAEIDDKVSLDGDNTGDGTAEKAGENEEKV